MLLAGIDIGGTKVEVVLIEMISRGSEKLKLPTGELKNYQILERDRIETHRDHGYESILERTCQFLKSLLNKNSKGMESLESLGIGLPGTVNPQTNEFLLGNTNSFAGQDIIRDFKARLGSSVKVLIENDANCFALAEHYSGAGLSYTDETKVSLSSLSTLGVILGTGCGGGYISQGNLLRGAHGGGTEIGHVALVNGGRSCYCGKSGCAENYVSGTGFEKTYQEIAVSSEALDGPEIFEQAKKGNVSAKKTIEIYKSHLAEFLGNIATVLDPHLIVLGGGLSEEDEIYTGLKEAVQENTFLKLDSFAIKKAEKGGSAGVLGAAFLGLTTH